jgi:hypothetical protein
MIVRTRGAPDSVAGNVAAPSKSPLASPRGAATTAAKSPVVSPRAAAEPPKSPLVSPRPAGATHLIVLDTRSDFIGPFVTEYEVMDKRTGKLAWLTVEDMDAKHGAGAGEWLVAQYERNPPPPRERRETVAVPEEPKPTAPAPTPAPAVSPAPAVALALKKKGTLLDKLDDAINRKLGGGGGSATTSPRRQVPPLDLGAQQNAEEGKSPGRKSPRGEELVDLPRSANASPRPLVSPTPQHAEKKAEPEKKPPVLEKKNSGPSPRAVPAVPETAEAGAVSPKREAPKQTVMERMRLLKELYQSGLIEAAEYETKRKQILDSL